MASKLHLHDVNFADLTGGIVVGPVETPSIDAVREVLLALAARHPDHPMFCRIERTRSGGGRWVPLDPRQREAHCVAMVSELAPGGTRDPSSWIDEVLRPFPHDRLLHYAIGHDHVQVWYAHVIGDSNATETTASVLCAALGDDLPVLSSARSDRFPLTRAMADHFGKHPRRVVDVLREPRPGVPRSGHEIELESPVLFNAASGTASADAMLALKELRRRRYPSTSLTNVLFAAIRRAFDKAGMQFASGGVRLLVDGRRYLPPGVSAGGNFAAAIYVEPEDAGSPLAIDKVLHRNLESGRPLCTMAVSATKTLLPWHRRRAAPPARTDGRPTLTISHLGSLRWYEALRPDPDRIEYRCASTPEGPSGITAFICLLAGRCTITAAYCPQVVPADHVAAALDLFAADPVALLEG